jgi:drug/metabolite transporter (DMT)-like permease
VYLFYLSIPTLGLARGTAVSYTYPLFATMGGALLLRERVPPRSWFAIALALGGLALLRLGDWLASPGWNPWYFAAIVGAIISGLAVVTIRKLAQTDSAPAIFLSQSLAGFWIVFVPALGTPTGLTLRLALLLLAIGLTAATAQLLMTWSYRTVNVATGSLLAMLTPAINVALGPLVFREVLGTLQVTGAALIMAACALMVLTRRVPR